MATRVRIKAEEPAPTTRRKKAEPRPVERIALCLAAAISLGQIQSVAGTLLRQATGLISPPEDLTVKAMEALPGWVLAVEQTREIASYILLCCICLLAGRSARERIAAFFITPGVMLLTKYAGLYMMLGWPQKLSAIDVFTTLIQPVTGPVWQVLLSGLALTCIGSWLLRRQ